MKKEKKKESNKKIFNYFNLKGQFKCFLDNSPCFIPAQITQTPLTYRRSVICNWISKQHREG